MLIATPVLSPAGPTLNGGADLPLIIIVGKSISGWERFGAPQLMKRTKVEWVKLKLTAFSR
jgi:hypothetical protein